MNGIVASLNSPPLRRLARATLILLCCVLSASLIGAVHTRPFDTDQRIDAHLTHAQKPDQEPILATFRPTTDQSLSRSTLAPSTSAAPARATGGPLRDVQAAAGAISTEIRKTLLPLSRLPLPAAPSPAPMRPAFTVRWMEVTAYCACRKCCGPRAQGLTASGKPVTFNGGKFVAADKAMAFNTRLVIPGYADGRPVPVLDRGGAIKGDKLDVYFPSHEQARQWGRRMIPVQVLN